MVTVRIAFHLRVGRASKSEARKLPARRTDKMPVSYEGMLLTALEAYRNVVSRLIENLRGGTPMLFTPFVY